MGERHDLGNAGGAAGHDPRFRSLARICEKLDHEAVARIFGAGLERQPPADKAVEQAMLGAFEFAPRKQTAATDSRALGSWSALAQKPRGPPPLSGAQFPSSAGSGRSSFRAPERSRADGFIRSHVQFSNWMMLPAKPDSGRVSCEFAKPRTCATLPARVTSRPSWRALLHFTDPSRAAFLNRAKLLLVRRLLGFRLSRGESFISLLRGA